jgi:hypothetical protein
MGEELVYYHATNCSAVLPCTAVALCTFLPFLGGITVRGVCTGGVVGDIVSTDIVRLDTFINLEQKDLKHAGMFELMGQMDSGTSVLESVGRHVLHTWNLLLAREMGPDACDDKVSASRTILTVGNEAWCADMPGKLVDIKREFYAMKFPRSRVRAKHIVGLRAQNTEENFLRLMNTFGIVGVCAFIIILIEFIFSHNND